MMTDLLLYGVPHSIFVRTTRMALEERRVPYTLIPCRPGHEEGEARHPFSKIPFMRYGDFVLAESLAIIRFAERTFPPGSKFGASLWPAEPRAAALCDQWVGAIMDVVAEISFRINFARLAAPALGIPVDESAVAAAAGKLPAILGELEGPLRQHAHLAGEEMSLADLYLLPILHYLALTPEGKAVVPGYPALQHWQARMDARASARATVPPSFDLLRTAA